MPDTFSLFQTPDGQAAQHAQQRCRGRAQQLHPLRRVLRLFHQAQKPHVRRLQVSVMTGLKTCLAGGWEKSFHSQKTKFFHFDVSVGPILSAILLKDL